MPLSLRGRPETHRDPAERVHGERRPLCVPRLRRRPGSLDRRLGQRDVAHVRDRRLHDAGKPDPREPSLGARGGDPVTQLVVAREVERPVEAGLVVAGVVQRTGRRPVRHRVGGHEVAPGELRGIETEPTRCDRHRALQPEVELRSPEPAVEAGGNGVREHDPVPGGHVPHGVGARKRAVHPVERGRLRRSDVGADVLGRVVSEGDQLTVLHEARLDRRRAPGRGRARGEVLEPVLRPPDGHTERARREPDEHDVGQARLP